MKDKIKQNHLFKLATEYFKIILTIISPSLNMRVHYWVVKRKWLNLKKPATFEEKISWMKLNYYMNDPVIPECADKLKVRKFLISKGLNNLLNDLYAVYSDPREIDWKILPNEFVLKWNFGCGTNLICKDKSKLDFSNAQKQLMKWKKNKFYLKNAEMHYSKIKPMLICEKFLKDENGDIPDDFKFYCFNGVAQYVLICIGRSTGKTKYYFFDREWNLARIDRDSLDAPDGFTIPKPKLIDRAFRYADQLSSEFPFVRVDLYINDSKIIFGELTFTPSGGINSKRPESTNVMLGQMLRLDFDTLNGIKKCG